MYNPLEIFLLIEIAAGLHGWMPLPGVCRSQACQTQDAAHRHDPSVVGSRIRKKTGR
jgi:hypothetical protein